MIVSLSPEGIGSEEESQNVVFLEILYAMKCFVGGVRV